MGTINETTCFLLHLSFILYVNQTGIVGNFIHGVVSSRGWQYGYQRSFLLFSPSACFVLIIISKNSMGDSSCGSFSEALHFENSLKKIVIYHCKHVE